MSDDVGGGSSKSASWRICRLLSTMYHSGWGCHHEATAGKVSENAQRTQMPQNARKRLEQVEADRRAAAVAAAAE